MLWRKLADGQHHTLAAKLANARVFFGASNLFEPVEKFQLQDNGQLKRQTQDAACVLQFAAAGSIVQTEMTNAHKTIRQDMREKAADKLHRGEGHHLLFAVVAVIEILESDSIFPNRHNAMIGDGNAEDVTTEILDQLLLVVERRLDIDFPIFGQALHQHILNIKCAVIGIEFAVCPELGDFKTETITELIGEQFDGEEELMVSGIPTISSVGGDQRPARDDEVNMQMLLHGLSPSVHDHRKANFAAEILLSELFQQLSGDFDEQIEK